MKRSILLKWHFIVIVEKSSPCVIPTSSYLTFGLHDVVDYGVVNVLHYIDLNSSSFF